MKHFRSSVKKKKMYKYNYPADDRHHVDFNQCALDTRLTILPIALENGQ